MEPRIERRNGVWYMILGDEASPMDGTISSALNAKAARMVEAQRRSCTCHLDDDPPSPCAGKYALNECRLAGLP